MSDDLPNTPTELSHAAPSVKAHRADVPPVIHVLALDLQLQHGVAPAAPLTRSNTAARARPRRGRRRQRYSFSLIG